MNSYLKRARRRPLSSRLWTFVAQDRALLETVLVGDDSGRSAALALLFDGFGRRRVSICTVPPVGAARGASFGVVYRSLSEVEPAHDEGVGDEGGEDDEREQFGHVSRCQWEVTDIRPCDAGS